MTYEYILQEPKVESYGKTTTHEEKLRDPKDGSHRDKVRIDGLDEYKRERCGRDKSCLRKHSQTT